MTTRFLGMLLTAALVASMVVSAQTVQATGCNPGGGGSGTAGDPFLISTPEQLAVVAAPECLGPGLWFRQEADITLSGFWNPIGDNFSVLPFQGNFDGGGKQISGLQVAGVDGTATAGNRGLFGMVQGGTIANVTLVEPNVNTSSRAVGAVAGILLGGTISNTRVLGGSVTGFGQVGGLVGRTEQGSGGARAEVTNSSSSANVDETGDWAVGGLIGLAISSSVTRSFATGSVSGTNFIGGLIGEVDPYPAGVCVGASIVDSYARGSVSGAAADSVGGLIGALRSDVSCAPVLTRVYATGLVTSTLSSKGGIAGSVTGGGTPAVANAFWDTQTTGLVDAWGAAPPDSGATGKTTSQMQTLSTYTGWTISDTWSRSTTWVLCPSFNGGYPYLATFFTISDAPCGPPPCTADLFSGGSGTEGEPFQVSEASELASLRGAACLEPDLYFRQTSDITLTSTWTPIGSTEFPFQGNYDGDDYTIDGLHIEEPLDEDGEPLNDLGLFGYTDGAVITSVNLIDVDVVGAADSQAVGGLIGEARDTVVSESSMTGAVTGAVKVGGLVGFAFASSIRNSSTSGSVGNSISVSEIGGIVGRAERSDLADISSTSDIALNATNGSKGGGVAGNADYSSIVRARASGDVTGHQDIGGLVGSVFMYTGGPPSGVAATRIHDSHASGDVAGNRTDSGSSRIGGLIGALDIIVDDPREFELEVSNSSAVGDIQGHSQVGGLIGHTSVGAFMGDPVITVDVTDSTASGEVTGATSVGGFFGYLKSDVEFVEQDVSSNSASGNILGESRVDGVEVSQIGGFVGYVSNLTISQSVATGTVAASGSEIGGFAGLMAAGAALSKTRASGNVTGSASVGGLVGAIGEVGPGSHGTVSQSFATGAVTSGAGPDAGGLVGWMWDASQVSDSFSTGAVSGGERIGGLTGMHGGLQPDVVVRSYASGAVSASTSPANVGGVFGNIAVPYDGAAQATYWNTQTTGQEFPLGGSPQGTTLTGTAPLTNAQMRSSSNFIGWDFNTVWGYQCGVSTTPVLRWANPLATSTFAGPCPMPDPGPNPAAPSEPAVTPGAPTQPPVIDQLVTQVPGTSSMTIGGQVVQVERETGARGRGVTLSAGPVTMTVRSITPNGRNVPLAADGSLILARSGEVPIEASGLAPGSVVTQTLFSDPVDLGSTMVDASGDFSAAPKIPANTPLGSHTLSVRGTTNTGEPFTLNIGVTVATPAVALGADPILTVKPARSADVPVVKVTARGVQARCMVTFRSGKTSNRVQANAQGVIRTTLTPVTARSGRVPVTMRVSGKGCSPITVSKTVRVPHNWAARP